MCHSRISGNPENTVFSFFLDSRARSSPENIPEFPLAQEELISSHKAA